MTTPTKQALTRGQRIAATYFNPQIAHGAYPRLSAEIDKAIAEETAKLREALIWCAGHPYSGGKSFGDVPLVKKALSEAIPHDATGGMNDPARSR